MQAFDLVLFGGTGDLAMRKLLPALFRRHLAGQIPASSRVLGVARGALTREAYVAQVRKPAVATARAPSTPAAGRALRHCCTT